MNSLLDITCLTALSMLHVVQLYIALRTSRKIDALSALIEAERIRSTEHAKTHDLTSRLDELQSMRFSYMGRNVVKGRSEK